MYIDFAESSAIQSKEKGDSLWVEYFGTRIYLPSNWLYNNANLELKFTCPLIGCTIMLSMCGSTWKRGQKDKRVIPYVMSIHVWGNIQQLHIGQWFQYRW